MLQIIDTQAQRPSENPTPAGETDEKQISSLGCVDEFSGYAFNLAASINRVYAAALNQAERKSR